jgi:hypothetical protein
MSFLRESQLRFIYSELSFVEFYDKILEAASVLIEVSPVKIFVVSSFESDRYELGSAID